MEKTIPTLEQANEALDALKVLDDLCSETHGLIGQSYLNYIRTMRNSIMRRVLIKKEFHPAGTQRAFDPILRGKK